MLEAVLEVLASASAAPARGPQMPTARPSNYRIAGHWRADHNPALPAGPDSVFEAGPRSLGRSAIAKTRSGPRLDCRTGDPGRAWQNRSGWRYRISRVLDKPAPIAGGRGGSTARRSGCPTVDRWPARCQSWSGPRRDFASLCNCENSLWASVSDCRTGDPGRAWQNRSGWRYRISRVLDKPAPIAGGW